MKSLFIKGPIAVTVTQASRGPEAKEISRQGQINRFIFDVLYVLFYQLDHLDVYILKKIEPSF